MTEGLPYTPGADEYAITERHTHSDIMRFIVEDIGLADARAILDGLGAA